MFGGQADANRKQHEHQVAIEKGINLLEPIEIESLLENMIN